MSPVTGIGKIDLLHEPEASAVSPSFRSVVYNSAQVKLQTLTKYQYFGSENAAESGERCVRSLSGDLCLLSEGTFTQVLLRESWRGICMRVFQVCHSGHTEAGRDPTAMNQYYSYLSHTSVLPLSYRVGISFEMAVTGCPHSRIYNASQTKFLALFR